MTWRKYGTDWVKDERKIHLIHCRSSVVTLPAVKGWLNQSETTGVARSRLENCCWRKTRKIWFLEWLEKMWKGRQTMQLVIVATGCACVTLAAHLHTSQIIKTTKSITLFHIKTTLQPYTRSWSNRGQIKQKYIASRYDHDLCSMGKQWRYNVDSVLLWGGYSKVKLQAHSH